MLKRLTKGKMIEEFELGEDMNLYSRKERQLLINRAFKERYLEIDASIFLNKNDLKELEERTKRIDSLVKWTVLEKKVLINQRTYILRMCVRKENKTYYIHSISSIEIEEEI